MANEIRYSGTLVRDGGRDPVIIESGFIYRDQSQDLRATKTVLLVAGIREQLLFDDVTEPGYIYLHNRSIDESSVIEFASSETNEPLFDLPEGDITVVRAIGEIWVESNVDSELYFVLLSR